MSDAAAVGMSSMGQKDVAVTPLQNAMIAAAIANGGVVMQPYLVDRVEGPDLSEISTTAPSGQRRAVSPEVATKLTDLMVGAEKFTQQNGAIPGVEIVEFCFGIFIGAYNFWQVTGGPVEPGQSAFNIDKLLNMQAITCHGPDAHNKVLFCFVLFFVLFCFVLFWWCCALFGG